MSQEYVGPTRSNMCEYCRTAEDKQIADEDHESECYCYRMSRLLTLINIRKSVLVIGRQELQITGIEFYNMICEHPYWVVKFKNARLHVLVPEDQLPSQLGDDRNKIRYIVGGMSYEKSRLCSCIFRDDLCIDCTENESDPLIYLHMKRENQEIARAN